MPTYEYRCKDCGEHLEVVQSFTDDALTDCPACGVGGSLRKVFGSIGITFKGSGFYKTDSRGSSSRSSSSSSGSEGSSASTDGSASSGDSGSSGSSGSSGDSSSSSSSSESSSTAKTA